MKFVFRSHLPLILLTGILAVLPSATSASDDWPWWRGPDRNGIASAEQEIPGAFSEADILWSVDLPGRSHGSAIVMGDRVILAAADEKKQTQSLLCFDRATGKPIWTSTIHEGGFTQKTNKKASWASSTPASDGERVFIPFVNGDAACLTAVSLESGEKLWQKKICDYKIHQGYGSSPAIHQDLVIVTGDNKLGGAIVAFRRESGEEAWRIARAEMPNYPSPIILEAAGKTQLFLTGTERVSSFDPLTGKTNWEIEGATTECVTSTVTDGLHIYSSGGYPKNHVAAIKADGSGEVAWETNDRVYVPSMIVHEDHLYAVADGGIALCWDSATGEEKWKYRLGGNFSASPVLVGETMVAVSESGMLYLFPAHPDSSEVQNKQQVADEVFATPTICGGQVFLRAAFYEGETRTEKLICFGK